MNWLRMIKEHSATSFHIELDDLDYTPFDVYGGRDMMNTNVKEILNEIFPLSIK